MLNMICCVKQVPDPETPASQFKVDEATKKVLPVPGIAPVISQFDAVAVEAALRIKDKLGEGKVTVVTLGPEGSRDVLKHGLAMGADEGVLLTDKAFEDGDHVATANALAAAIQKLGSFDLVFCGRQAVDWDMGVVGSILAEMLGLPCVTLAKDVQVSDGKAMVERILLDGIEKVETPLPALITVSNELGEPRYPQLRQIMAAARKEVSVWSAGDIGLDASKVGSGGSLLNIERLYVPVRESQCEFVEGDSPEESAQKLAQKLREAKLI
jgi:electron transfer flavoprotein beta subunit